MEPLNAVWRLLNNLHHPLDRILHVCPYSHHQVPSPYPTEACPKGTYHDLVNDTLCIVCPAGKYADQIGSKVNPEKNDTVACEDCPVGRYVNIHTRFIHWHGWQIVH